MHNVAASRKSLTQYRRAAQASIAIPIHQGPEMSAFAVYGIHRDGTMLDPDEVDALERLCDAAAQAYTYIEVTRYRAERGRAPAI
ncbi:MAG TPA: hypothetical protein VJP85_07525 [Candidatus Baltobacteraceae bacterium]|nr:hypothetical protein [Candidatus Baltobacteraceae bacterium]